MALPITANKKSLCQHRKGKCQINAMKNLKLYKFSTFSISLTTDELKWCSFFVNVKITHTKCINYWPKDILDFIRPTEIFCPLIPQVNVNEKGIGNNDSRHMLSINLFIHSINVYHVY